MKIDFMGDPYSLEVDMAGKDYIMMTRMRTADPYSLEVDKERMVNIWERNSEGMRDVLNPVKRTQKTEGCQNSLMGWTLE